MQQRQNRAACWRAEGASDACMLEFVAYYCRGVDNFRRYCAIIVDSGDYLFLVALYPSAQIPQTFVYLQHISPRLRGSGLARSAGGYHSTQ